jgi:uridine phosphorylase
MKAQVTFPKSGEKHRFTPLITSEREVKTRYGGSAVKAPRKAVLVYDRALLRALTRKEGLRRDDRFWLVNTRTYVTPQEGVIVAKLPIGAPVTAMVVEDLVTMGTSEFLILGTAGGLVTPELGDVVLCNKAIRDEGTSHHYLPDSVFVGPDPGLKRTLMEEMQEVGLPFRVGPTWTIDAPYRETLEELMKYSRMGILTVEMEASTLFAVSKARGAHGAAVFMVSDVLTEKGWSGFVRGTRSTHFAPLVKVFEVFERMRLKRY